MCSDEGHCRRRDGEFELFADGCRATGNSVLTIAVAKAILETNRKGQFDLMEPGQNGGYCGLLEETAAKDLREAGRRYPDAGYGGLFRKWLSGGDPRPYGSFGNEAAVRVTAAGFAGGRKRRHITAYRRKRSERPSPIWTTACAPCTASGRNSPGTAGARKNSVC